MRSLSSARRLAAVLAAGLSAAASAQDAAPPEGSCEQVVALTHGTLRNSAWMKFALEAQAHQTTKTIVDALGQKLGPGWREGTPFWEEAYARLLPDVRGHLAAAAEVTYRHQAARIPGALDPEGCRKHSALLRSKPGETASRIDAARDAKNGFESYAKAFPVAARLEPYAKAVRAEIEESRGLTDGPEVRRAREALRRHERGLIDAVKKVGDGHGPEQAEANRAFGAELIARHKDALVAIVRRFRAAGGP